MRRLNWPMDRTSTTVEFAGNTSAASIPLALVHELDLGHITPGDHVLMSGFGAGMTWASSIVRWGGVVREGGHGPAWHAEQAAVASAAGGATA